MTFELATPRGISWMSPESGLWVATRHGEFLGMIERQEGRYRASDSRGRARGSFEGLAEAQIAVDGANVVVRDRREVRMLRATVVLAGLAMIGLAYGLINLVW